MTIFEALREDHEIQRDLIKKIVNTSGESDERKLIFNQLKHELAIHANAEERFFYKPLIMSDMTQDKARHGISEHHELDELIEKLEATEMSSAAWLVTAKELAHRVEHHLEEEEHEFFQIGGKVLSAGEKESLAKDYQAYIKENRLV